jgi:twinkle protein
MVTDGEPLPIVDRKITQDTCKKYGYLVDSKGRHLAPFFSQEKRMICQHVRYVGNKKAMPFIGEPESDMMMFGQQLFAKGGNKLYICEGEVDTLSAYQALGSTWPVVGLAGANRVDKVFKANLDFIQSFKEVVLLFDNDEAGRNATEEALNILPYGKTKYLVEFPEGCKDINDILVKHGGKLTRDTIMFKCEKHEPESIVDMESVVLTDDTYSVSLYPWDTMNRKLLGRRSGEITMWTSGSGMGKSTILRSIYSYLNSQRQKTGMIMLEESPYETKMDIISQKLGIPVRKVRAMEKLNKAKKAMGEAPLFEDIPVISSEALAEAEKSVNESGVILVDSTKGFTSKSLMDDMRYLAVTHGVKSILLDHITIMVDSDKSVDDANKAVDVIMSDLRNLAKECDISIDIISHIRKKGNGLKSTNRGSEINIEDLKGSGGLYQISNVVIALERDVQDDEGESNITLVRSLKDRMDGYTGTVCKLEYDKETGRLTEFKEDSQFTDMSEIGDY